MDPALHPRDIRHWCEHHLHCLRLITRQVPRLEASSHAVVATRTHLLVAELHGIARYMLAKLRSDAGKPLLAQLHGAPCGRGWGGTNN